MDERQIMNELHLLLGHVPGATPLEHRRDGWWMRAPRVDVVAMAGMMRRLGARLATMTALALEAGETAVIYHYVLGPAAVNIRTETRGRSLPSIAPVTRAADWIEREVHDLFGVEFLGHPNLVRLIRPAQAPQGLFRTPGGETSRSQG